MTTATSPTVTVKFTGAELTCTEKVAVEALSRYARALWTRNNLGMKTSVEDDLNCKAFGCDG